MIALIYFEMQFLEFIRIPTVMFAAAFFKAKFSQISACEGGLLHIHLYQR
jgi:hypothetical protein